MSKKLLKKGSMLFALMVFLAMTQSMSAQYCVPEATNPARFIDNFSTTNGEENISNLESGFSADGYGDFYETHTTSQNLNQAVDFSVDIMGGTSGFRIWVDWNQDGVFDEDEVVFSSSSYKANHTGTIEVPADAEAGATRMRIVSHWLNSSGEVDPCITGFEYGEFEDYKFEVLIPEVCTGMPDAGIAVVNPTSGNPGATYTVSAQNYTVATEMTFQWQSNTDGAGWVDQGDATAIQTSFTATAPTELGVEVEWRLALSCTPSGDIAYSDIATFNTVISYCAATSSSVEPITKIIFAGIDNSSSPSSTDGYEDFTAIVAQVEEGETYTIAAEGNTGGSYTNYFTVWIDWNHDGEFEADEMYEIGSITNSDGTDGQQATFDIVVPEDAVSGETRMRIRKNYNSSSTTPCGSNPFGQVEDYTVNVGGGTGGTFPAPYCDIADSDEVTVEEITAVDFAGTSITNTDATTVLIDKTDTVVNVTAGETYTIVVKGNTNGDFTNDIVGFIDWNQNEILNDAGEVFEIGTLENSSGSDEVSVTMEITVPADAVPGETRIRITKTYTDEDSLAEINPCAIEFDAFGYMIVPGFGQALDFRLNVEESSGLDCTQGDDSNGFENGLNITGGGTFRNADDFVVSPDNTLNIQSIEINVLSMQPITSLDINFYNDDDGAPGSTVVESVTGVVPYAQVIIGAAFGYNVYSVFVEVDLEFEGGATGTNYWMEPAANGEGAFWEVSSVGTLGEPIHSSEAGGAWTPDEDGSQGVFKLHCDVAAVPPTECMFNITSTIEPITRVVMANVDNVSSANSTEALEDFTDQMIMVSAGESYDVAMEGNTNGSWTNFFTVFINTGEDDDWSSYETFEIGSIAGSTGTDGQQATNTITIPTELADGEYILRVVKNFNSSPLDPCSTYSFGQGEDYTLVVGELDDCTGTPDAGVASVNPEQGNANSSYTVSAADYDFANGLTYQWQSNTDGAGWVDEGSVSDNYTSFEATAPSEEGMVVEWRLKMTCSFSSETAYSETATFTTTTAMGYCIPVLDCADGDMITNVTFQEINNTTACSANGYGDYTDMTATVEAGGTFPISVSVGDGWMNESVSVWIDFNDDGTFGEDEFFYIGTGSDEALTGEISIPAGIADGDYRMRVRVAAVGEPTATWDMACDEEQGYGETEDYTVNVGVVGIDDNTMYGFAYYPNPMEEVLFITAQKTVESISAYNLLGQEVISNKHFNDGQVDVSSLPSGTFMFRVTFDNGHVENFKAIKK